MFIDASPDYTDTETNHIIKNPIAFHCYIHKQRNIVPSYTNSTYARILDTQIQSTPIQKPKLKPAPMDLKKAMFSLSSKAILKSLTK